MNGRVDDPSLGRFLSADHSPTWHLHLPCRGDHAAAVRRWPV